MLFTTTEIPHFLTNEECDYIIKLAEQNGLESSIARGGLTPKKDLEVPNVESKYVATCMQLRPEKITSHVHVSIIKLTLLEKKKK